MLPLVTGDIDYHNKGKSRVQVSDTDRSAEPGTERSEPMTAREARNTHDTAHNAGLTDLKLKKADVRVSSLIQATAMTSSTSARDPDVMPTETKKTSSGIFRMEPAHEKPTQRCGQFFTRKKMAESTLITQMPDPTFA